MGVCILLCSVINLYTHHPHTIHHPLTHKKSQSIESHHDKLYVEEDFLQCVSLFWETELLEKIRWLASELHRQIQFQISFLFFKKWYVLISTTQRGTVWIFSVQENSHVTLRKSEIRSPLSSKKKKDSGLTHLPPLPTLFEKKEDSVSYISHPLSTVFEKNKIRSHTSSQLTDW